MAKQTIQTTDNLNAGRAKINANFDEMYLSGSWTPVLYGSTVAGSPTYSSQGGAYNRIGNIVIAGFTITLSSVGGIEGEVRISGLPYACTSDHNAGSMTAFRVDLESTYTSVGCRVPSGSSYIQIRVSGDNGQKAMPHTYLVSSSVFWGQVIYRAAPL